jgi:hypothetical protein
MKSSRLIAGLVLCFQFYAYAFPLAVATLADGWPVRIAALAAFLGVGAITHRDFFSA